MCVYFVVMVVLVSVVCINVVVLCVMLDEIIVVLWELNLLVRVEEFVEVVLMKFVVKLFRINFLLGVGGDVFVRSVCVLIIVITGFIVDVVVVITGVV